MLKPAENEFPDASLQEAREISYRHFGKKIEFFLPGMFIMDGRMGRYPAVSITGGRCELQCDHCRGRLLAPMIDAQNPDNLFNIALKMKEKGRLGLLISGGSNLSGALPWSRFIKTIEKIVNETGLIVTVHAGYLNRETAESLKNAGAAQALVDVIGDDETARRVYHLKRGAAVVRETLDALAAAGLETVPHIVLGLNYGRIIGECQAVDMLADYKPTRLVTVVISPMSGTPMKNVDVPSPARAAEFLVYARKKLPDSFHHLGCARPRGPYRWELDRLAVKAGVNALALPSDTALKEAEDSGLETYCYETCCSLAGREELKQFPSVQFGLKEK